MIRHISTYKNSLMLFYTSCISFKLNPLFYNGYDKGVLYLGRIKEQVSVVVPDGLGSSTPKTEGKDDKDKRYM